MRKPAKSNLGRKYTYRPPHALHPLTMAAPVMERSGPVPSQYDARALLRPVRDQGSEGDCFAFSGARVKEYNCAVFGGSKAPLGEDLAPAYLAWRVRLAEGTFPSDSGASMADTFAVLRGYGCCPESFMPYQMNPAQAGDATCDVAAQPYRIALPKLVDWFDPENVKAAISAQKVIGLGFICYQSFEETGSDGNVKPVGDSDGQLGGHAVVACGYTPSTVIICNSWGPNWGDAGFCYMPWSYLQHWVEALTA